MCWESFGSYDRINRLAFKWNLQFRQWVAGGTFIYIHVMNINLIQIRICTKLHILRLCIINSTDSNGVLQFMLCIEIYIYFNNKAEILVCLKSERKLWFSWNSTECCLKQRDIQTSIEINGQLYIFLCAIYFV